MKKSTIWLLAAIMALTFIGLLYMQISYMENMVRMRNEQFSEAVKRSLYDVSTTLEQDETKRYLAEDIEETQKRLLSFERGTSKTLGKDVISTHHQFSIVSPDGTVSNFSFKELTSTIMMQPKVSVTPKEDNNSITKTYRGMQEMLKGQYLYQKGLLDEVILNILSTASNKPIMERVDARKIENYLKSELQNNGLNIPFQYAIINKNGKTVYNTPEYAPKKESALFTQILFPNDPPNRLNYLKVYFPTKSDYIFSSIRFMIPSFAFTMVMLITFIFTIVTAFRQKKLTEMKNDFINNMTHEFKTPISTISLAAQMLKDPAVRIHYASKYASSANYWKNAIGMNEGLVRLKVLDTKRAQQEQLLACGREKGDDSYQKAFDEIRSIVAHRRDAMYHQQAINEALVTALDFMKIPSTTALTAALEKKDKEKIQKALDDLKEKGEKYFASVPFPEVEKLVGKQMLKTYMGYIPKDQRIGIFKVIDTRFKGNSDAFIDACFKYSIFGNKENFEKFLKKPSLNKMDKDWMILFKYSITDGLMQTALAMHDANKNYDAAHKIWVKGMMDMRKEAGIPIYPDANSTLRLTYGKVASYEPADGAVYQYYTTLKGAMEKEDPDNWEFVVPAKLKQLYEAKDYGRYAMKNGEMPVCFIVDTDNTGGNSGSPVFNGKGQLIGTGFDRNYEGLTGDIAFRPSSQRAACVDIRYTLFIIEKYAGASHIIKEMDISD